MTAEERMESQCEAHGAHSDAYATHEAHLQEEAHTRTHMGAEGAYECPHCHRIFRTQQSLAAHLRFCRRRGEDTPSPTGEGAEGTEETHIEEEEALERAERAESPFEPILEPREVLKLTLQQAQRWGLTQECLQLLLDESESRGEAGLSPSELHEILSSFSKDFTGLRDKRLIHFIVKKYERRLREEEAKAHRYGLPYYATSTPLEGRSEWWRSPSPQPYSQPWNPSPTWRGSASPPYAPPPRFDRVNDPYVSHLESEIQEFKERVKTLEEELKKAEYESLEARIDMLEKRVEEKLNNAVELKKVEIQREGLEMFRDMQRSLSRKLDKVIDLLISLGKGEKIVNVRNEIPEYEEVEGEENFEDYLPPEFIEEG